MADIKTNQERDELFRRIYKIATDLVHAGHVSEWDFKSYVLGTMFYRYISETSPSMSMRENTPPGIKTLIMPRCRMKTPSLP